MNLDEFTNSAEGVRRIVLIMDPGTRAFRPLRPEDIGVLVKFGDPPAEQPGKVSPLPNGAKFDYAGLEYTVLKTTRDYIEVVDANGKVTRWSAAGGLPRGIGRK